MKPVIRLFIGLLLVSISLSIIWLTETLQIPKPTTGYFVFVSWAALSLMIGIIIFLIVLYQAVPSKIKTRKDASQEFFERLVNHLYRVSREKRIPEDEIYSIIEEAKNASNYGVKPAKWFTYASFKSVRYTIEYLSQENHVRAMSKMIESGTPAHVVGKYLRDHVLEHQQIKDQRDRYLARKYL